MPYKHKEVELTREMIDALHLPIPPQEFKASPLYRGHSWDTTTEGYELFRRIEYYGKLPTERWKGTPCPIYIKDRIDEIFADRNPVEVDHDTEVMLWVLYRGLKRRVESYNRINPTYLDQKAAYFEDMRMLYNRHGDTYRKSDPRRKINHRLEYNEAMLGLSTQGFNLNVVVNSILEGKEADRRNEAIITYDVKSMPGILPGNGMAKHYYNKYNDGIITLCDIPNKYIDIITNLIETNYEVVQ